MPCRGITLRKMQVVLLLRSNIAMYNYCYQPFAPLGHGDPTSDNKEIDFETQYHHHILSVVQVGSSTWRSHEKPYNNSYIVPPPITQ